MMKNDTDEIAVDTAPYRTPYLYVPGGIAVHPQNNTRVDYISTIKAPTNTNEEQRTTKWQSL